MCSRRFLLVFSVCALLLCQPNAFAQNAENTLNADVLAKTLYATTPAEVKYCENVINARNTGTLPNKILFSAYKYAVQKNKDRRMIYFEIVITDLCKKQGIVLPFSLSSSVNASSKSSTPIIFSSGTASVSAPMNFFKSFFTFPKPKFSLF